MCRKYHLPPDSADRHVVIANAGQQISRAGLIRDNEWQKGCGSAAWGWLWMYSTTAQAMDTPVIGAGAASNFIQNEQTARVA